MFDTISVLLLAAGASSRMKGTIKQLLPWENSTLLGHAIQQATKVTASVYVVLGANMEAIKAKIPLNVETIYNPQWENGMGSSISAGVEHILKKNHGLDGLLIMLADQPLLDATYLNEMKNNFKTGKYKIVATEYGVKMGVPAIFHASLLPELTKLNQDYGARNLLKNFKSQAKTLLPNGREVDIDTIDTYCQLTDKK